MWLVVCEFLFCRSLYFCSYGILATLSNKKNKTPHKMFLFLFAVPNAPTKVHVQAVEDSAVLKWEKPDKTKINGLPSSYYIVVRESVTGYTVDIKRDFNQTSLIYVVKGLRPFTKYTVEIKGKIIDYGPSVFLTFTTGG